MDTAVALIIFNRPDTTAQVFDQIARARPRRLFVIADGPRADRPLEADKCAAARTVVDRVDWPCEVARNYSDVNLGVGTRPASGIQWVFKHVDRAIILEDDCVPHPTFFPYCEELLDKYADDERVMHISGDNWHFGRQHFSYFFSAYCYSCGWATWRRAFQHYDPNTQLWGTLRNTSWLMDTLGDRQAAQFWATKFDATYAAGIHTNGWDWPWLFACWAHRGLSILPSTNLISNIGFSKDATHTRTAEDERAFVPAAGMPFPLRHPPYMIRNTDADRQIFEQVSAAPGAATLRHRLRARISAALPPTLRETISRAKAIVASATTMRRGSVGP
jgi:hypothetical protein